MMNSRKLVIVFSGCNFLFFFTSWMVFYYLPLYLNDLGLPDGRAGLLIGTFSLTTLFLVAFFGVLSDRFSPRKLLQLGISLFFVCLFGLYFSRNFSVIFILLVIGGSGSTLYLVSIYSLYYKHLGPGLKGKKIGIFLLSSFLGFGLGPLLGGFISRYGYGESIFAVGSGLMFFLFLLTFTLPDSPALSFTIAKYKNDLKRKEVFLLVLIVFIMGIHFGTERVGFSLLMEKDVGLTRWQMGQIFFFLGLWLGVFSLISGHLFDMNKGTVVFLSLGLFISGTFQVITILAGSYLSLLVIRLAHIVGDAFIILTMGLLISSLFPGKRMGGNFGFIETVRMGGAFLGALVSGILNGNFGYKPSFVFSGLLVILLSLYLFPLRRAFDRVLSR